MQWDKAISGKRKIDQAIEKGRNRFFKSRKDKNGEEGSKYDWIRKIPFKRKIGAVVLAGGLALLSAKDALAVTVSDLYKEFVNTAKINYNVDFLEPNCYEYNQADVNGDTIDGICYEASNGDKTWINLMYSTEQKPQQEYDEANILSIIGQNRLEHIISNSDEIKAKVDTVAQLLNWQAVTPTNPNTDSPSTELINYPNPFTDKTTLKYNANSDVMIYSVVGEFITNLKTDSNGKVEWDGTNGLGMELSSGVYLGVANKQKIKIVYVK